MIYPLIIIKLGLVEINLSRYHALQIVKNEYCVQNYKKDKSFFLYFK